MMGIDTFCHSPEHENGLDLQNLIPIVQMDTRKPTEYIIVETLNMARTQE